MQLLARISSAIIGLLFLISRSVFAHDGFIENMGQVRDQMGEVRTDVRFSLPFSGGLIHLTDHGFTYDLLQSTGSPKTEASTFELNYHRIEVRFENAQLPQWEATQPLHQQHFYLGTNGNFTAQVFDRVVCKNLYSNIDIEFLVTSNGFKYNIIARPGSNLNAVQFSFLGPNDVHMSKAGILGLQTRFGVLEEHIPESFLQNNGTSTTIDARAELSETGTLTFKCPAWDGQSTLVIDPIPHLLWSTYLGGPMLDQVEAIDTDTEGNIYVAGFSQSAVNIATSGSYQGQLVGAINCVLIKYLANGQKEWGTYLGGGQGDRCYAMTYHDPTAIYLAATTFSPGLATVGANQTQINGADDMLIARFDNTGNLLWATYHGGNDHDFPAALATSASGDLYVTGHTRSSNNIASAGAYDLTFTGLENAFLMKFSPWGLPIWGTYIGNDADRTEGIGVDSLGHVYVAGSTSSTTGIAGGTAPFTTYQGERDGFAMSFSADGDYRWGTYLGGASFEDVHSLHVSNTGNTTVVANTESAGLATPNAHQTQMASIDEGLIVQYNANGTLLWATYFGGDGVEYLHNINADADGNLVIAGMSESNGGITSNEAFQPVRVAMYDAFVAEFTANGQFRWGTFFGGEADEQVNALAIDPRHGHIVLGGLTQSNSAMATPNALQISFSGGLHDGFVARICEPILPQLIISQTAVCLGSVIDVEVTNQAAFDTIHWGIFGQGAQVAFQPSLAGPLEFTASVVDTNACPISRSIATNVHPNPEPEITSVGPWLAGVEAEFQTASNYTTYLWAPIPASNPVLFYTPTDEGADSVCVIVTDSVGCEGSACFVFEVDGPNDIPPALSISSDMGPIILRDLLGRVVFEGHFSQAQNLKSGTYLCTWPSGKTIKFVLVD